MSTQKPNMAHERALQRARDLTNEQIAEAKSIMSNQFGKTGEAAEVIALATLFQENYQLTSE